MKSKKLISVLLAVAFVVLLAIGLAGCNTEADEAQGVLIDKILIGNTAATTGDYAGVGVPFNHGLRAALKVYNDKIVDGIYGAKKIELIHYDDGFDGAQGLTLTKKLVEEDKIFALVGHFGTNTVQATVSYIKQTGIPMVYAATGVNELYNESATGNDAAVMPVQPIYKTEGRVLVARALAAADATRQWGLGGTKLGVISTTDDAGKGMLEGINRQLEETTTALQVTKQEVDASATDFNAAITALKNAGCDVVIAACNQAPLGKVLSAMSTANYNAKVITSYVNANAQTLGTYATSGYITENRPVFTTAWLDISTEAGLADYMTFAGHMAAYEAAEGLTDTYVLNSYAMAGFIAGNIFVQGIERVAKSGKALTWTNFIEAMEDGELNLLMGGAINYTGGARLGIADLAVNTLNLETGALASVDQIASFDAIWAKVPSTYRK